MSLKIAMIGAGSIGFTRRLIADILTVPELGSTHFALMDINEQNLSMVQQLVERDILANGLPASVTTTTDRCDALQNADYIICTIRQGGLDAFATDIDIPLKVWNRSVRRRHPLRRRNHVRSTRNSGYS